MASEASWQTNDAGGFSGALHADESMDQRTVESLLRRLVDRVEESERRYGEALDELHVRLDQLSQTTEVARDAGRPADDDTFERLHTQVSNLARRLEDESATSLNDFERLGRALTGGVRGDAPRFAPAPFDMQPEPSPFAQAAALAANTQSRLAPAADLDDLNVPTSHFSLDRPLNLDKRLAEMTERLEQSICQVMPTRDIQALNARLDEIGNQFDRAFETVPSRGALEHVERQLLDMGQQLSRAERQLGKVDGVEAHLLKLIERLDKKNDAGPAPADPVQLQEIAAKAATEAARIVADDSKKTGERLDALHRDLTSFGDKSRESGDKVVSTLEAVHESLKQLVQQVERGNSLTGARQLAPFIERGRQAESPPAAPFPFSPPPQAAKPALRGPEMRPRTTASSAQGDTADVAVKDQKLRDWLSVAALPALKEMQTQPPFGRGKQASPDQEAAKLDQTPDDLVAAARRAALAAAARAEERGNGRRSREQPADSTPSAEAGWRKRSWLMISAAALLVVSAILLYGRLNSKPEVNVTPAARQETVPAPADTADSAKTDTTAPATGPDQTGSWAPLPSSIMGLIDLGQAGTQTEMSK
jgi:localization factor PodJL